MKKLLTSSKQAALSIKRGYDDAGRRAHILMMTAAGALTAAVPELSYAVPTIGDIGNNAGDQSTGLTSGALRLAGFVGIVMVIIAFVKGRTARQQGESIGGYVTTGVIGALLLAVTTIVSIVNVSLLGSDASQTIQGQIIQ